MSYDLFQAWFAVVLMIPFVTVSNLVEFGWLINLEKHSGFEVCLFSQWCC